MSVNLTVKEVELISRMAKRAKNGTITTHRSWFIKQCSNIGISDGEAVIGKLASYKLIKRSSNKNFWPVTISIYKD